MSLYQIYTRISLIKDKKIYLVKVSQGHNVT